jgi:hypothetical protein
MTPIGYLIHGHPLCLSCVGGDDGLDADGAAYARDGHGVALDVVPIHPDDPDDGAPCAGCGQSRGSGDARPERRRRYRRRDMGLVGGTPDGHR